MRDSYVYILASRRHGTLYVGCTSNLIRRIWEHKNNVVSGFTAKYKIHQLVYYEIHRYRIEALRRESRIKNWRRNWKLKIIEEFNPHWSDLYDEICA